MVRIHLSQSDHRWGAVGCVCAFAAIALKCTGALMFDSWFNWVDSPANPLIAGWSLVVFLAGKRWLNVPYGKVIGALSSASFGIYLVHPIFLNVFYKVGHVRETFLPPLVFEMVIWALTFAGSCALTMILNKVPLIKRLL
ncbi:acyltransferase family protein [Thermophilibacter provencensis]|uniref:acyltransferase family protein n=1 Tax=Thermophilibacter provencensis TaxID=1852386 RepID=UPI00338ED331